MNSIEKALYITGKFESAAGYSALAGNFDSMGMSFGVFQWNAGTGTLQPLLRRTLEYLPFEKAKEIFTNEGLYVLKKKLENNANFTLWCKTALNTPDNKIVSPWRERFIALGKTPECQKAQLESSQKYINNAKKIMNDYGFKSERAFCLCFDISVQNGSVVKTAKAYYTENVKPTMTEKEKLMVLAEAVARGSRQMYQADVRSRKMTIARGTGTVHGAPYNLEKLLGLSDGAANF